MNARAPRHCLVVGAGVVGACCAWHLVAAGHRVTLVDREEPGRSTSYGNAACISPSHVVPFSHPGVWKKLPGWLGDPLGPLTVRWRHLPWVAPWLWRFWREGTADGVRRASEAQAALMHHVTEDWAQLLAATGQAQLVHARGAVVVYETPAQFESDRWIYDREAELGFPWEELETDALRDRLPALTLPGGVALFLPSWQHTVDPGGLTAAVAEAALAGGASWRRGDVRAVVPHGNGVRLQLDGAVDLEGDTLVLATGAWSNRLVATLDRPVPLAPKRGYHAQLPDPGVELDLPVISGTRSFVMTPLAGGLRLAGTAEFARLDAPPDYRRARVLLEHARRYFPGLREGGMGEWMGQRPMMADSVPVISPSPRHARVIYAFGHGHYGLTQGATTGRIVAHLVNETDPGLDLSPYRIDRFRSAKR